MNMVEQEINDMAVSKHSSHLAEMSRITKDIKDYVDPLCATLAGFLAEWEKETESFMKAAAAVTDGDDDDVEDFNFHAKEKIDRKTHVRRSIFPVAPPTRCGQSRQTFHLVGNALEEWSTTRFRSTIKSIGDDGGSP